MKTKTSGVCYKLIQLSPVTVGKIKSKVLFHTLRALWIGTNFGVQFAGIIVPVGEKNTLALNSSFAQAPVVSMKANSTCSKTKVTAPNVGFQRYHAQMSCGQTLRPTNQRVKRYFVQQAEQQHRASISSLNYGQTHVKLASNFEAHINALHMDASSPSELRSRQALRSFVGYCAHVCKDNGIASDVTYQICCKRVGRQGAQQAANALNVLAKFDTEKEAKKGNMQVQGVNSKFFELQHKSALKTPSVQNAFKAYQKSGRLILPQSEVQEIVNGVYNERLGYRKFHPNYLIHPELRDQHVGGSTGGLY